MVVAVNGADRIVQGGPGQTIILSWLIKNQSETKWPKEGIYLRNHCDDDANISPVYIKDRLDVGQSASLNVSILLPEDLLGKSRIMLSLRFEKSGTRGDGTAKNIRFGETLIGTIILVDRPLVMPPTLSSDQTELQYLAAEERRRKANPYNKKEAKPAAKGKQPKPVLGVLAKKDDHALL